MDSKSNEITAIPELLNLLNLKGALVTIDAMGCQKEVAKQIVDRGGDYVLPVKDNQPNLASDILNTFVAAQEVDYQGYEYDTYTTEECGHGRQEKREYTVLYNLDDITDRDKWENLKVIGTCFRQRTVGGKMSEETTLFISSRRAGAKVLGEALRGHWGIENPLHWQLDITFGEDDSSVSDRNIAQNLALLRKLALALLQRNKEKASIATKRYMATLDSEYLQKIIADG